MASFPLSSRRRVDPEPRIRVPAARRCFVGLGFALTLVSACTPTGDEAAETPTPMDLPDAPLGTRRIETPPMTVAAGQEQFWCYFGSFDQTVGVHKVTQYPGSAFLHHLLMKEVPQDSPQQDGDLVNCLDLPQWWGPAPSMFEAVGIGDPGGGPDGGPPGPTDPRVWAQLPDGVSFLVHAGDRFVLDSHFINPSDQDVVAVTAMDLELVPEDEVEAIAGSYNHNSEPFEIPSGGLWSTSFDCPWEGETTVLSIGPHMHEYGASYAVDLIPGNGDPIRRVLDVPTWGGGLQDAPQIAWFEPGELVVAAGDQFRTTCTWDNTENHPLAFPTEMCTTFGVAYPLPDNAYCGSDNTMAGGGGGGGGGPGR